MINLVIRIIRKLVNREFYNDTFVAVDPIHERDANNRNGPTSW